MARRVSVVPHVHWDREWYQPFQSFRLRLVELLDTFLPAFDADPSYRHFLLDGQMAAVDDYLAVRPEAHDTLVRLAASGRLAVGPWYILMDEFLVSAETIIRNLQLGIERAAVRRGHGRRLPARHVRPHRPDAPDPPAGRLRPTPSFGGGVPAAVDRTAFWWQAPDGSTVRAEYLPVGYGNGASLPDDAKALVRRVAAHETELGDLLGDGDGGAVVDERHRPPGAPALARPGRRRGQRAAG